MIVLGMDTATSATAVALRMADGATTEARDDPPPGAHPGHATRLLAMAHDLLVGAGVAWSEVDRIAVGVGPGTFTGLRVGVASARGLALSLSAQLVAVSSTLALARAALDCGAIEQAGADGVIALVDARRGEMFAAAYDAGARVGSELAAPRALAPEQLHEVVEQADAARGTVARRWLAVGDGAVRYREAMQAAGLEIAPDASPLHRISAAAICTLGAAQTPQSAGEVVPDYRRRPDAELALQGAGTGAPR